MFGKSGERLPALEVTGHLRCAPVGLPLTAAVGYLGQPIASEVVELARCPSPGPAMWVLALLIGRRGGVADEM